MVTAETFWALTYAVAAALAILAAVVYHNRRRLDAMSQRLFGSDLGDDMGVLDRLDNRLEGVSDELESLCTQVTRQNRLDTEQNYQLTHLIDQIDEIDGVTVRERPDGWAIHGDDDFLRGGSETRSDSSTHEGDSPRDGGETTVNND